MAKSCRLPLVLLIPIGAVELEEAGCVTAEVGGDVVGGEVGEAGGDVELPGEAGEGLDVGDVFAAVVVVGAPETLVEDLEVSVSRSCPG